MIYELRLKNEKGEEIVHTKDSVKMIELINALKINDTVFESEYERTMALVNFIASIFDVKSDDILKGLDAYDSLDILMDLFYKVLGWGEKKRQAKLEFGKNGIPNE